MRQIVPMMTRRRSLWSTLSGSLALAALVLPLGGCTDDPFERPGTWRPAGVNESNLRAQVTDPAVLQRGVGAGTARGQQGATAITTLEAGKRPPVPTTALTAVGVGGSQTNAR